MTSELFTAHPGPFSTASQEADTQTAARLRPSASRRRDKPQLSCDLCRRRKLRCDRQQPCSTCSSRGQTCTYPEDSAMPPAAMPGMHHRLVQLERLVMSIASKPSTNSSVHINSLSQPAEIQHLDTPIEARFDRGIMHVSASQLHYVGGDHWAAILDSIADLKDHIDHEEQLRLSTRPDQVQGNIGAAGNVNIHASGHSLLLYGGYRQDSQAEILAALPPKGAVDRYISRYFNGQELVSSAIHGPTFLREYEAFWANPSGVPVAWVGLLFGMICLAVLASEACDSAHGNELEQQSLQISLYREKIAQSLILGEYTKSGPYVLETMIHYVYIEFAIRADADKDIWFLLALEVNLAMRMGCHRDPSHFPGLMPLESEMRRRLWATVLLGDILISSQMGMPRMISDWQCDTAEPRNLNDTDLDQDTFELPASRPETEITTALSTIARRRMLMALGTISDITANVKSCDYAEVMRAEAKLHEAAASIPQPFKMKSMTASLADSPQVIMARLFISHLFYKGQIMLHRRFVMASTSADEASFSHSRKACLDASLGMLHIQHVLDEETGQGGRLNMMRWRVSSIINHQFLTATMILCSLLYRGQTLHREEEIMTALRSTREIWMRNISFSQEAKKAADAVSFVLARAGEARDYGIDLDAGRTSAATMGHYISTNASGSDGGLIFDGQAMLQTTAGLHETNKPDHQGSKFAFNFNALESGTILDEWMMMDTHGTGW
ncbi:fungal-specific transcription factor [Lepidopterella palustris CBS 459.81]|uniref:Fungal-specific transcription factor n=1 Tax=Lepidopterella palustris CBS 459.81 TaxID=1314670 RepID=A0A8E2DYN8_9PEZI|nr:fungal-specific transcription factor [Lepidopterella palustris CBS 459.81]